MFSFIFPFDIRMIFYLHVSNIQDEDTTGFLAIAKKVTCCIFIQHGRVLSPTGRRTESRTINNLLRGAMADVRFRLRASR